MKIIIATKVKNGWAIKKTETRVEFCESDVIKYIKQQGLKVTSKEKGLIKAL